MPTELFKSPSGVMYRKVKTQDIAGTTLIELVSVDVKDRPRQVLMPVTQISTGWQKTTP